MSKLVLDSIPPTESGWYWVQIKDGKPYCVEVVEDNIGIMRMINKHGLDVVEVTDKYSGLWAGPIDEPKPKK